jgi:hypothetical protein
MNNIFKENYDNTFKKVISSEVEKKGNFDYLSWAYAVKHLKISYPESITEQVNYPDANGNLVLPYLKTELGFFVTCRIYLTKQDFKDGVFQAFTHPVLDNRNRSLAKPDSFQINTSYMRCLTKGIAITTGLGLSLYAGEDLPPEPKEEIKKEVSPDKLENTILKTFRSKTSLKDLIDSRDKVKTIEQFKSIEYSKINKFFEIVKQELAEIKADELFKSAKNTEQINKKLDEITKEFDYAIGDSWLHDLYQEYASKLTNF